MLVPRSLPFHHQRTHDCRECGLGRGTLPRCDGFGPLDAEVAIVGINPAVRAKDGILGCFLTNYLGTLQVYGREPPRLQGAERAFWHLAVAADLAIWRCYSTNAVKCATPGNRKPTQGETETCAAAHLTRELRTLSKLRKVLAFGKAGAAPLGLSGFGDTTTIPGTRAVGILLPHPIHTLRRWTALETRAAEIREFLGDSARASRSSRTLTLRP